MQKLKPIEYILVDIANSFGHDKLLWDERINWATKEVVPFILNQDEAAIEDLMADAKAPFLFRKACYAYEDALKQVPSGYMVGLDQTASGLQLFAVLTGCHKTAAAVNLINTGKREDVYQNVAEYMSKLAGKALVKDDLKTAIMTKQIWSLQA